MPSFPKSSHDSDSVSWDYHCTICKDKLAEFYCENCQKCYCQQCIHPHDKRFFGHIKQGRDEVDSWPAANDLRQQCKEHTDNDMDLYCFKHRLPCCYKCAFHNHRKCPVETRIPDSVFSEQEKKQAFIVQETSEHNVKIPNKGGLCCITGVCALPDGQVILADWDTKTVKLLDEHYQVVSYINVAVAPWDICQVTSNEAVLTVGGHIQFVSVNDKQLERSRSFFLEKIYECAGIAHHEGHLFITSGTALHEYAAENGRWLRQLYEDNSQRKTAWKCAVSPAGDKVYVSQPSLHTLLTLDMNGKKIATFHDPGLLRPWGLCVAPEGQIIVCGEASDTVLLVDSGGKRKLATLATYSNGLRWPWSVYYTKHTDSIIVGQWYDTIFVLKIQEREKGPFIRLICQKNKFLILKCTCETIEGILTICGQDLEAHALLDEKLHSFVSADYIQVIITDHLLNHARHVAIASGAANLTVGNDLLEIGHFGQIGIAEGIDVLPVDVYEECEQYCDTRFKTELGVSMTTTQLPSREDILTRIGAKKPVHIWGATSAPGLGTLPSEIFKAANGDYIMIRDRRAGVPFANEGDSGAMVCYFDPLSQCLFRKLKTIKTENI